MTRTYYNARGQRRRVSTESLVGVCRSGEPFPEWLVIDKSGAPHGYDQHICRHSGDKKAPMKPKRGDFYTLFRRADCCHFGGGDGRNVEGVRAFVDAIGGAA